MRGKDMNVRRIFHAVISDLIISIDEGINHGPCQKHIVHLPNEVHFQAICSSLPGLPAVPEHVFGRDEMVEKLLETSWEAWGKDPQHTALIGAVGTGKSAIARIAVNHATIA
jgi:hypothetical protein